ncbi:LysR family transcriptional regulator [Sutcliffiella rhizosphaerae]|uniref:HTH-type transcriptional regulator HdfR n=1 Tax=Sutcliffiella rhizosphaerae TaxID=2880967 RepID=A0ABM8YNZ9_9BACI|nr:LysR family transcriptional regulator [Sutcliffiella rhizosphaerae]CAG9621640.1 HTH-type transcriptional regulator HdfR [Sutcliffiella rhizosphaerae]
MELNWLRTFVTAAEHSNFRKASELLFLSQPTITVHIKQLEKEIGAQLFEREGRNVVLTEAGKRYAKHANELLNKFEEGVNEIHSIQQGFNTKLIIGISPLIGDTVLPFVLKQFLKKHTNFEITVKIIESNIIEKAVMNEEVDIGLSCLDKRDSSIFSHKVASDSLALVVPHDGYDSERGAPIDEEGIFLNYTLLTHNHPAYWNDLCQQIKAKYPTTKMMKVSQTHITKRFIIEGLGVSILPMSTVRRELMEGRLLEVVCKTIIFPEVATYALMKYKHTVQKEFLGFLSNYRI